MPIAPEERYSRQILFAPIGTEGQRRLRAASVVLVGCGATGSAIASLLTRAGIGTLRIIDRDYVEPSNLQRQLLFDESDAAQSLPKAVAAATKLAATTSDISLEPHIADLTADTAEELLGGVDLILDGTDNFATRYLINDFAVAHQVPWIYAAAVGSYGITMNILPQRTACLACVFDEVPQGQLETCDTAGILNTAATAVASLAATEAMKLLVGAHDSLRTTLLSFDLWTNRRSEVRAQRRAACRTCGAREFPHLRQPRHAPTTLCGRNSVQVHERHWQVDFMEMQTRLEPHGNVRHNEFVLKFWREPYEITLFRDGRAIVKGTTDHAMARSLYARYIGS